MKCYMSVNPLFIICSLIKKLILSNSLNTLGGYGFQHFIKFNEILFNNELKDQVFGIYVLSNCISLCSATSLPSYLT